MQDIYDKLITKIEARTSAFKWTNEKTYNI